LRARISALGVALCLAAIPVHSQVTTQGTAAPQGVESTHEELRALRDGLIRATNESNIDALLGYLHPNVVVTWQNAEVSRGREGVRAYLTRMTSGPNRIVTRFQTNPTVDELTILHGGDTGIAFGTSSDHFEIVDGMNFDLNGRWSATMVREDGRWLVANFHASTNLFDNPVLNMAKRYTITAGVGGLVVGALLALVGAVVFRRRQRNQ
jgi:ketosteroid isomerase-like protein